MAPKKSTSTVETKVETPVVLEEVQAPVVDTPQVVETPMVEVVEVDNFVVVLERLQRFA